MKQSCCPLGGAPEELYEKYYRNISLRIVCRSLEAMICLEMFAKEGLFLRKHGKKITCTRVCMQYFDRKSYFCIKGLCYEPEF